MKKIVFGLLFMLIACCVSAQQPKPVRPTITDESQAILKKMKEKWMGLETVKISFTLQSAKDGKSTGNIKGNLWTKGKSYRLSIPGQLIICDGKSTWNYLPQSREVNINPCEEDAGMLSLNPIQVISTYEKYYRSAFIREEAEKGIAVQIIDLYPKQVQSFYKIRFVIRKDKQLPLRAVIHEKDGSTDTYYFDQILFNPSLPGNFFTFDASKYPGIEIIDMR